METKKDKPAPLTPAELYSALYDIANNRMHNWQLRDEHAKAKKALDLVERKVNRHAEKRLRVMRAASVEEAEAILHENPADENLKTLCTKVGGFKALADKGATDEEIGKLLVAKAPAYGQGHPKWERGYSKRLQDVRAYVDPDDENKAVAGTALVAAVRRVMKIPKPAAPKPTSTPAKKPAPATKPAAKKAAPAKAPAPKAPPAKKDEEPAPAGVAHRPQTWGQWASTLRGINGKIDLSPILPELDAVGLSERERFFLQQFNAGRRPADARDAWQKAHPAPLASVAALEQPQAPIEPLPPLVPKPGAYYDAGQLAIAPAALEAAMKVAAIRTPSPGKPAPSPATIATPLKIAGHFWAVVGAGVEHTRVTYQLVPVFPETTAAPAVYDDFDDLVADLGGNKAPEEYDLDGLLVVDPLGVRWVAGDHEIYLRVPRDPAVQAAMAARGEALAAGKSADEALNAGTKALFAAGELCAACPPAAAAEDSHCNGKGEFVEGVEKLTWQTLGTTPDRPLIVIRVARGDDGLYRTGHVLAFAGAELWGFDSDEPVKLDGQAVGDRGYAIKTRALILITRMQAAFAATKDARQRRACTATIRALQSKIDTSPNVNATTRRPAMSA